MAERMAAESLSVPQLVKTISSGWLQAGRQLPKGLTDRLADLPPKVCMDLRIAVQCSEIGHHGVQHLGSNPGGGVVVHVNNLAWRNSHYLSSSTIRFLKHLFTQLFSTYSLRVVRDEWCNRRRETAQRHA